MAFEDYEIPMRPMTSDEVLDLLGAAIIASPFLNVSELSREMPARHCSKPATSAMLARRVRR